MAGYIACGEFLLLVASIFVRSLMLRRRGIRAFVFGATDRSDFLMLPGILLIVYHIGASAFGWPVLAGGLVRYMQMEWLRWVGVVISAAALVGLWVTLRDFGRSFRVGIDVDAPDTLVTTGVFALSRNPIYVCFFCFFAGMFLVFPGVLLLVAGVLFAGAIHRQVLREEKFLASHYGAAYQAYCRQVHRYL